MPYIKTIETPLGTGIAPAPYAKKVYTSEILTNKITALENAGDLSIVNEILPGNIAKATQTWKDEATFNAFNSWLNDSGELAKMQSYHSANNITPIIS